LAGVSFLCAADPAACYADLQTVTPRLTATENAARAAGFAAGSRYALRFAEPRRGAIHPGADGNASLSRFVDSQEGTEHRLQHTNVSGNLPVDRPRRVNAGVQFMLRIPREVLEHFNCDAHLRSCLPESW